MSLAKGEGPIEKWGIADEAQERMIHAIADGRLRASARRLAVCTRQFAE